MGRGTAALPEKPRSCLISSVEKRSGSLECHLKEIGGWRRGGRIGAPRAEGVKGGVEDNGGHDFVGL